MAAEPVCAEQFPLLKKLQEMRKEKAAVMYSKNAVLAAMAQTAVVNNVYDCVLQKMPEAMLNSLSSDPYFSVQMLVCMEMPGTKLEELPGPLHVEDLLEKVRQQREEAVQAAVDGRAEGFTVEDVQKALRAFASSHSVAVRWLRKSFA